MSLTRLNLLSANCGTLYLSDGMDRDEIASKAKIGDIVEVKAQKPKLQKSIRKKLGLTEKFDYYAGFVSINPKTIGVSHIKEAGELEYFIKYEDILEFEVLKSGV